MKSLLLVIFSLLTSCASIVSDSTYAVSLDSEPTGQNFTIKNEKGDTIHSGTTPEIVNLKSGDGYFSMSHYKVSYGNGSIATLSPNMDEWYWGNIIFGGAIGLVIVDPLTGAMFEFGDSYKLKPGNDNAVEQE
jgi:hypothetical protein